MIDIESDVFDVVAKALRVAHTGITVVGEYMEIPAKFPAVTLVEADNRVARSWRTCEKMENAVNVMYEMNVYSNKAGGKKAEAKEIANTADEVMASLGFMRDFREQVPNLKDSTIYRIVCRYSGMVIPNDDGKFYIYTSK